MVVCLKILIYAPINISAMIPKDAYFEKLLSSQKKLDEVPFDYERKMVSVLIDGPDGKKSLLSVVFIRYLKGVIVIMYMLIEEQSQRW